MSEWTGKDHDEKLDSKIFEVIADLCAHILPDRKLEFAAKRVLDVAISSAVLVGGSPILSAISVAVLGTMGRPILFRQWRPGKNGHLFRLYKFRTMRERKRHEKDLRKDAERLTTLGRLLRKLAIDELPELWNVLKGEMSLVGPRPLLVEYLSKYTPEETRRHDVKPGLTGWAQVNGREHLPFSERLRLDIWYVDHWSFWLDLYILARTPVAIFSSTGIVSRQDYDNIDDIGLSPDRQRI